MLQTPKEYRGDSTMRISLILVCFALLISLSLGQQNVGGTFGRDWLNASGRTINQDSSGFWNSSYPLGYNSYYPGYNNYGYPGYDYLGYPGYNSYSYPTNANPYLYDPQSELDQAIASHTYQILARYHNRFYGAYPWQYWPYMPYGMPINGMRYNIGY
jgi:hypothetical protein